VTEQDLAMIRRQAEALRQDFPLAQDCLDLLDDNARLRAALRHTVHKVEQTLAGQYPDGAALDSVLIIARAALRPAEEGEG
jgi:hypothetical protein